MNKELAQEIFDSVCSFNNEKIMSTANKVKILSHSDFKTEEDFLTIKNIFKLTEDEDFEAFINEDVSLEFFLILEKYGVDLYSSESFYKACFVNCLWLVKYIYLRDNSRIDLSYNNNEVLLNAYEHDEIELFLYLLSIGVDSNAIFDGITILERAIIDESHMFIYALLKAGCRYDNTNFENYVKNVFFRLASLNDEETDLASYHDEFRKISIMFAEKPSKDLGVVTTEKPSFLSRMVKVFK